MEWLARVMISLSKIGFVMLNLLDVGPDYLSTSPLICKASELFRWLLCHRVLITNRIWLLPMYSKLETGQLLVH